VFLYTGVSLWLTRAGHASVGSYSICERAGSEVRRSRDHVQCRQPWFVTHLFRLYLVCLLIMYTGNLNTDLQRHHTPFVQFLIVRPPASFLLPLDSPYRVNRTRLSVTRLPWAHSLNYTSGLVPRLPTTTESGSSRGRGATSTVPKHAIRHWRQNCGTGLRSSARRTCSTTINVLWLPHSRVQHLLM
jgi:hypothetical protein